MKKVNYLLPLLVVPFLFSCANNGGKDTNIKFSLSEEEIEVSGKIAQASIDWEPSNHKVKFLTCAYTCTSEEGVSAEFAIDPETEPRPMVVKITFKNDITEDKDGTLSFTYKDVTAGNKEGKSSIEFTIPAPDSEVTKEEFDAAIGMKNVEYLQIQGTMIEDGALAQTSIRNLSPTACYQTTDEGEEANYFMEMYSFGNYEECKYVVREEKGGTFSPETTVKKSEAGEQYKQIFPKPTEIGLIEELETRELGYDDFEYKNNVYIAIIEDGYDSETITLSFENKKITKFVTSDSDAQNTSTMLYSYEKLTPKDPRI